MGNRAIYNKANAAYSASNTEYTGTNTAAEDAQKRTYGCLVADAATAGTAVTETIMGHVRRAGIVKSVTITTPIAVTEAAANTATFTISKRTAGGAASTIATGQTITTTGIGSFTAFLPKSISLTAANVVLAAGDVLTIAISKQSSGVALTAATSYVHVSVDVLEVD